MADGLVGIIANPDSGKDIRRVVAHAVTVSNQQKVNIIARLLLSLVKMGVSRVAAMPDPANLGLRALLELADNPGVQQATSLIEMPVFGTADDSRRAAEWLRTAAARCIVVLGGDGTCRVVAKACGEVPLLPVSTGTNNIVPAFVEGTVAGIAAAVVAGVRGSGAGGRSLCSRHKRLLVWVNGECVDQALVDVALVAAQATGARAVWHPGSMRQIFVTEASPAGTGMSAVIGVVRPLQRSAPNGAWANLGGAGARRMMAPIAPGLLATVAVGPVHDMLPGVRVPVAGTRPAVLALDGEREITLGPGDSAEVALDLDGPWMVDVDRAMDAAVRSGAFVAAE